MSAMAGQKISVRVLNFVRVNLYVKQEKVYNEPWGIKALKIA